MICPNCQSPDVGVKNSDDSKDGREVIRMRYCRQCGAKWPTRELEARRLSSPIPATKRKIAAIAIIRHERRTSL